MKNIRYNKHEIMRSIKFLIFSITAGLLQILTFTLLNEVIKMEYLLAYIIALTISVLYNFTINRKFTFKSATNVPIAMLKVAAYYLVFTPLSTWWGDALTNVGWNEYIVLGITMVINFVTEFLFCKYVVYRNSIDSNVKKKETEDKTIDKI
ncbi:MAG: GtrA family protein [Clostridia bacterium]